MRERVERRVRKSAGNELLARKENRGRNKKKDK